MGNLHEKCSRDNVSLFPSQKEEKQNHDPSTAMIDTTMGKEQTVRTVWDPP